MTSFGNQYGFKTSNFAAGLAAGEAGGIIARGAGSSYYADLSIGGPWSKDAPVSASGRFTVKTISKSPPFNGAIFVGHFNRQESQVNQFDGHIGFSISEHDAAIVDLRACIAIAGGTLVRSNALALTGAIDSPRQWSYTWDPAAGLLSVTVSGAGGGTVTASLPPSDPRTVNFDSFGISSPQMLNASSQSVLEIYFDDFTYAESDGPSTVPAMPWPWLAVLILGVGALALRSQVISKQT